MRNFRRGYEFGKNVYAIREKRFSTSRIKEQEADINTRYISLNRYLYLFSETLIYPLIQAGRSMDFVEKKRAAAARKKTGLPRLDHKQGVKPKNHNRVGPKNTLMNLGLTMRWGYSALQFNGTSYAYSHPTALTT